MEKRSSWGQERRLEFIDFRLYWYGRVNRSDLVDFFDVSVPQASLDLKRYQECAPRNIVYGGTEKAYLATNEFQPILTSLSSHGFLDQLLAVNTEVIRKDSSFVGYVPPTAGLPDLGRAVEAKSLQVIVRAMQNRDCLRIAYHSMDHPGQKEREISPHALGFNGNRWHMRAYCYTHHDFRDFVLARLVSIERSGHSEIDPTSDGGWNNTLEAVVVPHPKLPRERKYAVELDFGMTEGRLVIKMREAMMFYLLDRLNLVSQSDDPVKSHYLFLENRKELRAFFRSHGI